MAGYPSKLSIGHDPPRMPTTLRNTSVYVNWNVEWMLARPWAALLPLPAESFAAGGWSR